MLDHLPDRSRLLEDRPESEPGRPSTCRSPASNDVFTVGAADSATGGGSIKAAQTRLRLRFGGLVEMPDGDLAAARLRSEANGDPTSGELDGSRRAVLVHHWLGRAAPK